MCSIWKIINSNSGFRFFPLCRVLLCWLISPLLCTSRVDRRLICPFKCDTDSCHHLHLQSPFNIINVPVYYILFKCIHIYIHAYTYIYLRLFACESWLDCTARAAAPSHWGSLRTYLCMYERYICMRDCIYASVMHARAPAALVLVVALSRSRSCSTTKNVNQTLSQRRRLVADENQPLSMSPPLPSSLFTRFQLIYK